MTRPFDKHLDSDELDRLISLQATSVSDSGQLPEQSLREAERHVESCQDCSRKLQMHQSVQSKILRMRAPNPLPPTSQCIGDAEWLEVAAGLLPEAKTRERMKHAAQCGHCGPLLKNAAEALVDETTPSEEAWLASLRSARPGWRKNMAETLRDSAGVGDSSREKKEDGQWWQTLFSWQRPAFAFAGIAVAVIGGWLGVRMLRSPSAEQLLAKAYTERRTLEVRIPGAKYAPMRVERSANGSNLDKSPSLLKAEALIGENLAKNPNDPMWLQARARADLLDGNYESAIKSLQRALETQPDSPSLLTDLGSAYFLRAESADRPIDYGNAIESLGKALSKSPDDPVALFNRALACERMFLYTQAVDDWEHYLRVEPQGEWAEDARKRLGTLKEKLQQHGKRRAEPLLTPAEIAMAGPENAALREKIGVRIEDYLSLATIEWLPKAYRTHPGRSRDSSQFRKAVELLADINRQQNHDLWLKDLLAAASSPHFSEGVAALSATLTFIEGGDFVSAEKRSLVAAKLFASAGNSAGELRARYETTRALHLAQDGGACLKAAQQIAGSLADGRYPWLLIQFQLEEGTCLWIVGDVGNARQNYLQAQQEAEHTNYKILSLRALNHLSSVNSELGDETLATNQALAGLSIESSAHSALMQIYNLYFALHKVAESKSEPYLDVVIWREAAAIGDLTPDVLLRAAAHAYLGKAAADTANMADLALAELSTASKEFASAPQTKATLIARAEAETRLADVELRKGKVSAAILRLGAVEQQVLNSSDNLLAFLFYRVLGEAKFRTTAPREAELTMRAAVALAEINLASLHTQDQRLRWNQETAGAYKTLLELKLRNGNPEDALEFWEWYRGAALRSGRSTLRMSFPSAAELKINPPDPSFSTVHSYIPALADVSVLSFAVFPDGIEVWLFDNRGIVSRWTPVAREDLGLLSSRFRQLCAGSDSDLGQIKGKARLLYDLLIAPVEDKIDPERVLVVEGDEDLNSIPFEALLDRDGHYLVERVPVVSSYGLYYYDRLKAAQTLTAAMSALIVSTPAPANSGDYSLPALVDADNEARAVAAGFHSPILLMGNDADSASVLKHLRTARIFHFAGHAVASPNRAGLLLSDALLNAEALAHIDLSNLALAVLSGCETANGTEGTPVDVDSLVRALQKSGVPHVVASRWKLDSNAARLFMQVFYTAALKGASVPRCLQLSENVLRTSAGMSRPYFWAALHDFGRS